MPLSSNSLFHFTKSIENLLGILEKNFIPFYSLETLEFKSNKVKLSIPMVCFCDIPLSQIKNHIVVYGNYGIGMSRDWAILNNLNPVLYLESNSSLANSIAKIQKILVINYISANKKSSFKENFDILRYIKNYQGNFIYKGKIIKRDYKYYDEKEWRYVPTNLNSYYNIKSESFNNNLNSNSDFSRHKLKFRPEDIKYLIVKDDSEIEYLINQLKSIKSKFSIKKVEILISKVLTIDQIFKDF